MSAWLVLLAVVGAWDLGFWAWCLEHAVLICVRRVAACCKPSMLQAACRGMRSIIVDEGAWKDATVFAQLATMSSPGNFFQLNASAQGCAFHCARCKVLIMLLPTCSSSGLAGLGVAALLRQPCASQQLFTYCVSPTRWPSSSWACNPSQAQAPCSSKPTSPQHRHGMGRLAQCQLFAFPVPLQMTPSLVVIPRCSGNVCSLATCHAPAGTWFCGFPSTRLCVGCAPEYLWQAQLGGSDCQKDMFTLTCELKRSSAL